MFEFITRKLDMRRLWAALKYYPEYAPPHRRKQSLKRVEAQENFDFFEFRFIHGSARDAARLTRRLAGRIFGSSAIDVDSAAFGRTGYGEKP